MDIGNICVLGKDGRMDYVAQIFYNLGYEVYRNVLSVNKNSIIILPPPVGDDVTNILLPYLCEGQSLYGGMISEHMSKECKARGVYVGDYLTWDEVTHANAVITGRGILKEAVDHEAVFEGSNCLVTGYGFCGKALVNMLLEKNACVDVMVRKKALKSQLTSQGVGFVDMMDTSGVNFLKYSYIFNTVPALILEEQILKGLSRNVLIFDIASMPGGVDMEYCKKNNIFVKHSLGIPGKLYPRRAGQIIADAILDDISVR